LYADLPTGALRREGGSSQDYVWQNAFGVSLLWQNVVGVSLLWQNVVGVSLFKEQRAGLAAAAADN
jgi:hypothetical protein